MCEVLLSILGRVGRSAVVAEFGPKPGPRCRDRGDGVPADGSPGLDAVDATLHVRAGSSSSTSSSTLILDLSRRMGKWSCALEEA